MKNIEAKTILQILIGPEFIIGNNPIKRNAIENTKPKFLFEPGFKELLSLVSNIKYIVIQHKKNGKYEVLNYIFVYMNRESLFKFIILSCLKF